jgi:hypothetical protein
MALTQYQAVDRYKLGLAQSYEQKLAIEELARDISYSPKGIDFIAQLQSLCLPRLRMLRGSRAHDMAKSRIQFLDLAAQVAFSSLDNAPLQLFRDFFSRGGATLPR